MHNLLKSHLFIIALFTSLAVQAGNKALDEKIAQQKQARKDQIERIRNGRKTEGKIGNLRDNAQQFNESAKKFAESSSFDVLETLGLDTLGEDLEEAAKDLNSLLFEEEPKRAHDPISNFFRKCEGSFKSTFSQTPDHSSKSIFSTRNIIIATVVTLISINLLYLLKKSKKEKIIIKTA